MRCKSHPFSAIWVPSWPQFQLSFGSDTLRVSLETVVDLFGHICYLLILFIFVWFLCICSHCVLHSPVMTPFFCLFALSGICQGAHSGDWSTTTISYLGLQQELRVFLKYLENYCVLGLGNMRKQLTSVWRIDLASHPLPTSSTIWRFSWLWSGALSLRPGCTVLHLALSLHHSETVVLDLAPAAPSASQLPAITNSIQSYG